MAWSGRLRSFSRSLTGRMVFGIFVIHVLLIPLLFGGVLYIVKQGYQTHFVNHVRSETYYFSNAATLEIRTGRLQALIDEALLSGRVLLAQVIDRNSQEFIAAGEQNGLPPFKEDFFYGQHGDNVYYVALPLRDKDTVRQVTLRLGYDETATQEQIDLAYRRGLYVALGYILASIALVIFLGRKLAEPLQRLRTASRKIAAGHFEEQLNVTTDLTEVKSLAEDLEHMRKELVDQAITIEHQALHDALTGLPNRALLNDRLKQAILNGQRDNTPCALLLMDLDGFKEINDTLGHYAGDLLLQQTATRLLETVRESDTVARLGGDEFAVILPLTSAERAQSVAENILDSQQQPYILEGQSLQIGVSLGITMIPDHGTDCETMLRKADVAMYAAKRTGSSFTLYEPDLDHHNLAHLTLASELREAIERGELVVYYQPMIDLGSGRTRGAEALLRWRHPSKGLIPPDDFIPIAEKTGLIEPLTVAVLREAINRIYHWCQAGQEIKIAVNLSPRNLQNPHFPETVANMLNAYKLDPSFLQLELTESAIFSEPSRALKILNRVNELGVRLSIDDFGTGYSSLAQLRKLPVSEIKIDRSFVTNMRSNDNDAAIVRSTIDLAHNLGLTVVAEGVEDAETLDVLHGLGCDMAQGYYISLPLPLADFERWLQDRQRKIANTK